MGAFMSMFIWSAVLGYLVGAIVTLRELDAHIPTALIIVTTIYATVTVVALLLMVVSSLGKRKANHKQGEH